MKRNTIWSVLFIACVSAYVDCIPVEDPGNGYKLQILSKDNRNSPTTSLSKSIIDKLDFSPFYEAVVKNVFPTLLSNHEKGSTPGKETTHHLGRSVTESLSKSFSDVLNSKLGQEVLIASGLKKRPTLFEILYETIVGYIHWIGTVSSNKVHEIRQKGLIKTFSDTFYDIFGSRDHGHISSTPHEIHHKPDSSSEKLPQKETREIVLEPRGLLDRLEEMRYNRNNGGPGGPGGRYYNNAPGPWNKFLYKPYDPNYPFSTMPPFMGGGILEYFGYLFTSVFYAIQEFVSKILGRPPLPPPGGRPSILRRPPQSYY